METRAHAPLPVYLSPKGPVSLTVAGSAIFFNLFFNYFKNFFHCTACCVVM